VKLALLAAMFALGCDHRWPQQTKDEFTMECVLNNMRGGVAPLHAKFYCACVADETERTHPVLWLDLPSTPADEKFKADTSKLCTERTYVKYPEAQ